MHLADGWKRELVLERLWRSAVPDPIRFPALVASEIDSLRELDVPFFRSKPDSSSIFTADGTEIPDFFDGVAQERIAARFTAGGKRPHSERVHDLIDASLQTLESVIPSVSLSSRALIAQARRGKRAACRPPPRRSGERAGVRGPVVIRRRHLIRPAPSLTAGMKGRERHSPYEQRDFLGNEHGRCLNIKLRPLSNRVAVRACWRSSSCCGAQRSFGRERRDGSPLPATRGPACSGWKPRLRICFRALAVWRCCSPRQRGSGGATSWERLPAACWRRSGETLKRDCGGSWCKA